MVGHKLEMQSKSVQCGAHTRGTVVQSLVMGTAQGHSDVISCFCSFVVQIHQEKHIFNRSTPLLSFFYRIVLFLWSIMSGILQNREKESVVKELH